MLQYVVTQHHAACVILTHHAASVRDWANVDQSPRFMGIQVHKVGASIPFPLERLNLRTVSETGRTTAKPEDLLSTRPTCRDHLMDRLSPVETSPNASHERTHVKDSTRRKRYYTGILLNSARLSCKLRPKWAGEHGQIQVLRSRETWNLSGLHHVTFGRLPDANATSPSTGPICSTQFDSSGQVRFQTYLLRLS